MLITGPNFAPAVSPLQLVNIREACGGHGGKTLKGKHGGTFAFQKLECGGRYHV